MRMSSSRELSPSTVYWILAVPLWAIFSWAAFNFQPNVYGSGGDFWEHSAAFQAWLQDLWHPQSPHVSSYEGSPRYMPFFFVITVLSTLFRFTALQAMGTAGVVNITLFVIGTKLFSDRYFRNPWAAPIALLVFLSGWGIGWGWSNVYQLTHIFYVVSYPSFFVFSFGFIAYWWLLGLLTSSALPLWRSIILVFIVSISFSSHPLTGVAIIVTMGLMITFAEDVILGRRVALFFVVLAGSLLVELWPYFSTWQVTLGTSGGDSSTWVSRASFENLSRAMELYSGHPFYQPLGVLLTFGPALLGVPMVFYLFLREGNRLLIAGCAVFSIPYLLNLFVLIPLGHRFLLYVIFFLHLSLVWFFVKAIVGQRYSVWTRYAGIGLLSTMVLWNVALAGGELWGYSLGQNIKLTHRNKEQPTIVDHMEVLANVVPSDAVIMAPILLAWPIPTFAGKVVSGYHLNPMVRDFTQRRKDVESFFTPDATLENRQTIINRYNVTHVLYDANKVTPELNTELSAMAGIRTSIYDLIVIALPDAN